LIKWLKSLDERPVLEVLEVVEYEKRLIVEARWTEKLKSDGAELFNQYVGANPSAEAIAKRRKRVVSEETRAKISAARRGKKLSVEHRARLSEAQRTSTRAAQHRADLNELNRGSKRSEEERRRIAEGTKRGWEKRRNHVNES